jgi:hypothetical protein
MPALTTTVPIEPRTELTFRKSVESDLGRAASALEEAATDLQRLGLSGITYTSTEDGDLLGQIQKLGEQVLALQGEVRKENHR